MFVTIHKTEFEAGLAEAVRTAVNNTQRQGVKFAPGKTNSGDKQYIYWVFTGIGSIWVKIFSTISPQTGVCGDHGEDSIKFVLWDTVTNLPLTKKMAYMQRIDTWEKNLTTRINRLFEQAGDYEICDECGSVKVEREGQYGKFKGCLNYRNHGKAKQ